MRARRPVNKEEILDSDDNVTHMVDTPLATDMNSELHEAHNRVDILQNEIHQRAYQGNLDQIKINVLNAKISELINQNVELACSATMLNLQLQELQASMQQN
jgi:hypothetical protein